jgi:hypothetical protein
LEPKLRAAWLFAPFLAAGLLDEDEVMPALLDGTAGLLPQATPAQLRCELLQELREAAERTALERRDLQRRLSYEIAPLLARPASAAEILAHARQMNEAAGDVLRDAEVLGVVEREMFWALRRRARGRR